jgi:phosphatidylglycerol---prolipoprotein diacylglyceryl transferase
MIPFFEQPVLHIGPLAIHAFSALLVLAIVVGRWMVVSRAGRFGIDTETMSRLCVWMLLSGFLGAHLVKTILPNVPAFLLDPLTVVRIHGGIASLGGLGGGLLGGILWCRWRRFSNIATLGMLDVIAYALPFAWMFGRLGCALAHDHRGVFTTSWIAVQFPEGPRYDLGLIEFLFLIGLATLFLVLDRTPRQAGFFFGMYGVVYGSFRIWLDTLHVQPLRFLGGATAVVIGLGGWAAMAWFAERKVGDTVGQCRLASISSLSRRWSGAREVIQQVWR